MKHLRATAKSGMAAKLARMRGGSVGGSASCGPTKGYATGGVVTDSDDGGDPIDGVSAKKSMSKPGRMKGGKGDKDKKSKGTNVNVIIMGKDSGPQAAAMPPPGPPPGPPRPPMAPPMPPPGAGPGPGGPGGPPPPMRASGGRVMSDAKQDKKMISGMIHKHEKNEHGGKLTKFKRGGGVLKGDGAGGGLGRLAKMRAYGSKPGKSS